MSFLIALPRSTSLKMKFATVQQQKLEIFPHQRLPAGLAELLLLIDVDRGNLLMMADTLELAAVDAFAKFDGLDMDADNIFVIVFQCSTSLTMTFTTVLKQVFDIYPHQRQLAALTELPTLVDVDSVDPKKLLSVFHQLGIDTSAQASALHPPRISYRSEESTPYRSAAYWAHLQNLTHLYFRTPVVLF